MAMIVDAFAGKLLERLTSVIEEKAIMVLGVKDELQRLQRRMGRIASVLRDAERKRIQDETVKGWVAELKDLMYDADDIIDLCMIQGTGLLQDDDHQYSPPESSTTSTRVRCNFPLFSCVRSVPLRYEIADKIKNLNDRLTEISEDKDKFGFISSSKSTDANVMNEASSHQSSSLPEPDIVGWDIRNATKSLVELLVSTHHEQKCGLYAVVGMGGIGKTTLAQQIYNDSKINDVFLLHSWIWVPKSFKSRETDLLKEIIRNTGGSYGESTTIAELHNILCNVLCGKSLFLVLDDVWDADVWTDLIKNSIERSTTKCKVLVTTRDRNTAIKMRAIHIHNVNKLPLDSGWELLCKKVFINNDKTDIHRMKDIGMQIVEKCDGLPVSIKAVAGVLVTKDQNKREWENVLNSDAWTITGLPEELRGALYLSYEDLDSALKHCFLYCCVRPREFEFCYEDLVCEWIAEGFIKAHGNASIEDIAKGYYMDLIRRSILQPNPMYTDMHFCSMHDLFRALAQFLAGDESLSGDLQEAQRTTSMKKLRRLTISNNTEIVSIAHLDYLRSLYLWSSPSTVDLQMIGNLKHLRLLVVNDTKIENIPDSIGDLVHLRLVDLDHTKICKLPDSLGKLVNLQFLLLNDCRSLHVLPRSITKLYNLRRLGLKGTPLNYVPMGIGKLKHLNHVTGFAAIDSDGGDGGEGCNLEELQTLDNLNQLQIENLEKASSKSALVLSNKHRLRILELCCTPDSGGHMQSQEMDRILQVFDQLCPPSCLERLSIKGYFGCQYPKWMSSTSINTTLSELTYLFLTDCSNCPQLPQLGLLPQLKYLMIDGATAVVSIGSEFLGNGEPVAGAFPKLEYLLFIDMTNWEEWSLIDGEEEDCKPEEPQQLLLFPNLKNIVIFNCPKLKALPTGLNQASNLQQLDIDGAKSLLKISDLPALKQLLVDDCPMLECVETLDSLQDLKLIYEVDNSTTLPNWLISFLQQRCQMPQLDDHFILHLECSAQALQGCLKGGPYWLFLQQVPRLVAYAEDKTKYLKYTKEPYSYETNFSEDIIQPMRTLE